jgi:endonuclease YncB( thermonuclease family)
MTKGHSHRAPVYGALFFLLLCLWQPPLAADTCQPGKIEDTGRVAHVHDGDTIQLEDGRKLRLIGINTPELARDGKPAEPYARKARNALRDLLLRHGNKVQLEYGQERHDRYQRLLVHIFVDGQNVNAWLLQQGLGYYIAVPPNLARLDCYRHAELLARKQQQGFWRHASPRDSRELTLADKGFMWVSGRVLSVKRGRRASYLNLPGRLSLRIPHSSSRYFSGHLDSFKDKLLLARGWVYAAGQRLHMNVHHPQVLEIQR